MELKTKILIVEDERIPAEFLKEVLEKESYEVVGICHTGASAIKKATELLPDIIFMDIMLKDNITGSEAALKISSQIKTKIIFLTAHCDPEMIEYALDSGAANYLIKPYKEQQILTSLKLALKTKSKPQKHENHLIKLNGGYFYNSLDKRLYLNNKEVELGAKSVQLIQSLCENIDRTISHNELSLFIYGSIKETSTIRALISRINKTLEYTLVENNNGLGYKIAQKNG